MKRKWVWTAWVILASEKCVSVQNNVCPLGWFFCLFGVVCLGCLLVCFLFWGILFLLCLGFLWVFLLCFGFAIISNCSVQQVMNMVRVSVVEDWFWNPASVPLVQYLILYLKNLQPGRFPANSYVRIFWEYVFAFGLTKWSYLISLISTGLNWKCGHVSSVFCLSLLCSNLILIENFTFSFL